MSPLAGVMDGSLKSLQALSKLIRETGTAIVAQPIDIKSIDGVSTAWHRGLLQMVFSDNVPPDEPDPRIQPLNGSDAPAMLSLAQLTKPGPFEARTIAMGRYWGIKANGKLIAMAGERLRQTGFTEISGVCTHPDHQGKGLGRALSIHAIREILHKGNTPYLHVFDDNQIAISLYASLGFRQRSSTTATALEPT